MDGLFIFLNGERGARVVEELARAGHEIKALVVPANKAGVVESVASQWKLDVRGVDNVNANEFCQWFAEQSPKLTIVAGFSTILKKPVIDIPEHGTINLHAGRLPQYRGGSPLNWQIIAGESQAGISVIQIDSGIDTGAILAETLLPINMNDTIGTMHEKANIAFPGLVLDVVNKIDCGDMVPKKQDEAKAYYWHQRQDEDGYLKPEIMGVDEADRFIRGLSHPYPGAFAFAEGRKIRLTKASIADMKIRGTAGRVCFIQGQGPYLICRDGALLLEEYNFENNAESRLLHGNYLT